MVNNLQVVVAEGGQMEFFQVEAIPWFHRQDEVELVTTFARTLAKVQ